LTFEPKYEKLLDNDNIRRWYENIKAGSKITADVYLRTLGLFCELNNTTTDEIIKKAEVTPKKFKNEFMDFVRRLEKENKAGSYIVRFKKTLRS